MREWTHSGLLEPTQAAAIEPDLRTELRRTNLILRIVLFGFSMSVLQSFLGLFVLVLNISATDQGFIGVVAIFAGIGAALLAEFLIASAHFYRFGVEEACAVLGAGLVTVGVILVSTNIDNFPATALVVTASIASLALYLRYGYLYGALLSIILAAAIPFVMEFPWRIARSAMAVLLLGVFVGARALRRQTSEDFRRDEYGAIEAVSWAGIYLAFNLRLWSDDFGIGAWSAYPSTFFWGTYVAIWILPILGLALAIRDRHRAMIWVNLAMALATLATNKEYLGWPHHTWDPILLGLLLVGTAVGVRRWLTAGPGGERAGFTRRRILSSEKASLSIVSTVAGAVQPGPTHQGTTSAPDKFEPGGGSSGGGGATGRY